MILEPGRAETSLLALVSVFLSLASGLRAEPTRMRIRLLDAETGRPTPAMACIRGRTDGAVRLPPAGKVTTRPTAVEPFYRGIRFEPDSNWIGPVRQTLKDDRNQDQGGRADPYEVRPSIPYWNEPVMYQVSGDFTIDLPAGHWRLAVEHGMEYVPVVEDFEIAPGAPGFTRELVLKRWIDLPAKGWWSGDVHVHHPIQEPAHREYLLHYAVAEDLHVVNILEMGDHHQTHFKQLGFGKAFRAGRGDFWLVAGQEDPRSTFGHIIGLNISELARDTGRYDFYDVAFKKLHQQPGALVGFAHLAWNGCDLPRGFPWYVTTGEIDFVEVLQFSKLNAMDYHDYLNLGFRLTAAAGSDVPWGSTIGEVRTYVYTGGKLDIDAWFAGLKSGRSYVTNGPALDFRVNGAMCGAQIDLPAGGGSVKVSARVWGHPKIGVPTHLTVVSNDGVVRELANPDRQTELALEFDWPVKESRWLVASTVCDNAAVAHTTPVYVVVNGRPTWSREHGPAVIDRQLAAIAGIEREVAEKADDRSAGIRVRLEKARVFYADLREKMSRP
ncbi:MAG: hypothetical protein AMXMBFR83_06460 [Phycisphaerae bacterium]